MNPPSLFPANQPDWLFRARIGEGGLWLVRRCSQGAAPDVYLRTYGAGGRS
jgi:hypothetical protein